MTGRPQARPRRTIAVALLAFATIACSGLSGTADAQTNPPDTGPFQRVATFPVFLNTNIDTQTVAEIVSATEDGNTLVYTDSANEVIGFVDITDPHDPQADGIVALDGEPTSVTVVGRYALAAVNTSESFVNPSGKLQIVDVETRRIVRDIGLGGQPDSIAASPNGRFAVVAIENERDEDLGNGEPPQLPGGYVVIVDIKGPVERWRTRVVDLAGIPDLFPTDPEPEFVDINQANKAVITLQENNYIVVLNLLGSEVMRHFSAMGVDLDEIDTHENGLVELDTELFDVPREPDGVAWTGVHTFATADEGDLFGGSRGFTVFNRAGEVLYRAGNQVEHAVARIGHYPEERSENKGSEPEGVEYGVYADGTEPYLFVGSERASVILVYAMPEAHGGSPVGDPVLVQILPTGVGPEGLLALPNRDLFVTASEEDDRGAKIRSAITIYERADNSAYPKVKSVDRANGTPIPWGALSGLVVDPSDDATLYSVYDSFYQRSRIFQIDHSAQPALIVGETELDDSDGLLLGALLALEASLPPSALGDFDPDDLVNADGSVNLDPEGVTVMSDGSFWVASEGAGNLVGGVSDPNSRPFESPDLLVKADSAGNIVDVAILEDAVTLNQLRFGFEGVAVVESGTAAPDVGESLYVAFQREWTAAGDPDGMVRIGRYDPSTGDWAYVYYPLDPPTSPNGGWVGLSDITWVGNGTFAVIERDDQAGADARVKRIYSFSIDDVTFLDNSQAGSFDVVTKTLEHDVIVADDFGATGGVVLEKLEGLAILSDGTALVVNDNDGVDDSSGETQLLDLGDLFQ